MFLSAYINDISEEYIVRGVEYSFILLNKLSTHLHPWLGVVIRTIDGFCFLELERVVGQDVGDDSSKDNNTNRRGKIEFWLRAEIEWSSEIRTKQKKEINRLR